MTTTTYPLMHSSKIVDALIADRCELPNAIAHDLVDAEHEVRRSLGEIIERATALLDKVNSEYAYGACSRIAHSAGASGPIGSEWEKAIAAASRVEMIVRYSTLLAPVVK